MCWAVDAVLAYSAEDAVVAPGAAMPRWGWTDCNRGLRTRAPRLRGMVFHRGIDGAEPLRARPIETRTGAYEERHAARGFRLAATLACPRCDAPVALAGRAVTFSQALECPFCRHPAPLRDFLSLATPTRPARVEVRATVRDRASRR